MGIRIHKSYVIIMIIAAMFPRSRYHLLGVVVVIVEDDDYNDEDEASKPESESESESNIKWRK